MICEVVSLLVYRDRIHTQTPRYATKNDSETKECAIIRTVHTIGPILESIPMVERGLTHARHGANRDAKPR